MNKLVSIIVPVYNVGEFIEKGIESFLKQTYKNIEIILVDDGSTDNSSKICDKYAKKDNRIKVLHKKNGGVSSARNAGLKIAKGDYILFVDGDDYIDEDYTEYFVELIGDNDMAFNINAYDLKNNTKNNDRSKKIISADDATIDIYLNKIGVAVWNKIYKREFLLNNNITFNETIWYGEGMLFNIQCLHNTEYIPVGKNRVYHIVYNTKSATRDFNLKSNYNGIMSMELQKEYLNKCNKKVINSWNFHRYCFNYSIVRGLIKSNKTNDYYDDYKKCIKNLKKQHFVSFKTNINFKKKIKYFIISLFPVLMAKISIRREYKKIMNNS